MMSASEDRRNQTNTNICPKGRHPLAKVSTVLGQQEQPICKKFSSLNFDFFLVQPEMFSSFAES